MSDIDPAGVMAAHEDHVGGDESQCVAVQFAVIAHEVEWDEHCAAYLTAEALAAEQAKTEAILDLVSHWQPRPARKILDILGPSAWGRWSRTWRESNL